MCLLRRYPDGYTLLFISSHSPAYTGSHWAVYDQDNLFCGFDDGDTTSGGEAIMRMLW